MTFFRFAKPKVKWWCGSTRCLANLTRAVACVEVIRGNIYNTWNEKKNNKCNINKAYLIELINGKIVQKKYVVPGQKSMVFWNFPRGVFRKSYDFSINTLHKNHSFALLYMHLSKICEISTDFFFSKNAFFEMDFTQILAAWLFRHSLFLICQDM